MNAASSTSLIIALAALGVGGWFLIDDTTVNMDPTTNGSETDSNATTDTNNPRDLVDDGPSKSNEFGTSKAKDPVKSTPPIKPKPAPLSDLARRLGTNNADAKAAEAWYELASIDQQQHLDTCADGGGIQAGREFNQVMQKHRDAAVKKFGVGRANQILGEMPVYMFELGGGTLFRVDAQGVKIPFRDPKMRNAWSNFERR